MSLIRHLLILGLFLTAAIPGARAQSVALNNGNSLALYGLTFAISNCTISGTTCAAAGLNLENVAAGRGNIEFQVVNSNSANPVISRALNAGAGSTTLSFRIDVSQTANKPTTLVTSATLIDTGIRKFTCSGSCSSGTIASASLDFDTYGADGITITADPLVKSLSLNQSGVQTATSAKDNATGDNNFNFVQTLTLTTMGASSYTSGSGLKLNSVAVLFRAAPEPASITALLVGLTGLAMVRLRRRRVSS